MNVTARTRDRRTMRVVIATLCLECSARSHIGRRKNNEDAVYSSPRLAAVADGVGGAAAGEVASGWIIQALQNLDKSRLGGPLDDALREAIAWGNETIGFVGSNRPQMSGMSTTLTAVALANDGTYTFANIGDSRTYLLREGELTQLSRDDSFVQHMIDEGHLTVEQARRHPSRSLVLEALDGKPDRRPVITTLAGVRGRSPAAVLGRVCRTSSSTRRCRRCWSSTSRATPASTPSCTSRSRAGRATTSPRS